MNNIGLLEKNKCVGCYSCVNSCLNKSIEMKENDEGFFYPSINNGSCIDCGICILRCPILTPPKIEDVEKEVYSLIAKDTELLNKSSSGGVFASLAKHILLENGVVFGCAFDQDLNAQHILIDSIQELERLQGSKYVASSTNTTYQQVKELLQAGKKVLYSGSPCHIAGLKSFLIKDYDNLFTIDLICHGTPSQKLFTKYLEWLGKRNKEKIIYYGFRDKDVAGWSCGGKAKTRTRTRTRTRTIEAHCDPYYASFLRNETFRESCYICPYANIKNRPADITIGDFWGVEKYHPEIDKEQGVSVCIINTIKGNELFSLSKELFYVYNCEISEVLERNHNLIKPSSRPKKRDFIYNGINSESLEQYFKKFDYSNLFVYKIKRICKKLLKKMRLR